MCGFAGFSGEVRDRDKVLERMVGRLGHRGPDGEGFFFDQTFSIGFCRLAIIDPHPESNQPLKTKDGQICLVCNGEIYNYTELRRELQAKGYRFRTKGDAEVLLHGYCAYGLDIIHRLRGMFAFAIRDLTKDLLFCARDLFGIKPFYYTKTKSGDFLFASEIKAFLAHPQFEKRLNESALRPYLTFQHALSEQTFFQGVSSLPPAHILLWQGGEITVRPYADRSLFPKSADSTQRLSSLCRHMEDSVFCHRRSDVPMGAFLSGGVDSAYLCALARPSHTFSVGFCEKDGRFDEIPFAKQSAQRLGLCHHHRYLEAEECFDAFSDMQYHLDEPHANPSVVPLWFLAKEASRYVKVVLSGEGADELFCGYEGYFDPRLARCYKQLPKWVRRTVCSSLSALPDFRGKGFLTVCDSRPQRHYVGQAWIFSPEETKEFLRCPYRNAPSALFYTIPYFERYAHLSEAEKKQQLDLFFWLPDDILQKADKMSMASSLELRVPYLDRNVFAFARQLTQKEKFSQTTQKLLLRQAAAKEVGTECAFRKKCGFPVPIRHWLREDRFADRVGDLFSCAESALFFDQTYLHRLLKEHRTGECNHARKLWCIYTFLTWYFTFFKEDFL